MPIIKTFLFAIVFISLMLSSCKTSKPTSVVTQPQVDVLQTSTRKIKVIASMIEVDHLGNLYVVDQKNILRKYGPDLHLIAEFANNRLGNISSIDVTNPLNTLLFFKDHGHILVLDNLLSMVKEVSLTSGGKYISAGPVCASNDRNYWVFDPQTQKIYKIDDLKNTLVETNHFNDLNLMGLTPIKLVESGNFLVALIKNEGFLVFDNFGQFIKIIPNSQATDFQFDGKAIIYRTLTGLKMQGLNALQFSTVGLPIDIKSEQTSILKLSTSQYIAAYPDGIDVFERK